MQRKTGVNGIERAVLEQLIRVAPPSLSVPVGIEGLFCCKNVN